MSVLLKRINRFSEYKMYKEKAYKFGNTPTAVGDEKEKWLNEFFNEVR